MVSIIVPIYNAEKYLEKCVESILNQTYRDYEVLLVDDGSTDRSVAICDQYASVDARIHVMHQENSGIISARQAGFRASSGEWILFVDSDDWIATDMVEQLLKHGLDTNADVVTSGVIFATDGSAIHKFDTAKPGVYADQELQTFKQHLLGELENRLFEVLPYLWNKLWRREVLEKSLLNVDSAITVGEDVAIGIPAMLQAKRIAVMDEAFYYYRQDNNSMLHKPKNSEIEFKNAKKLFNHLYTAFNEAGYSELAEHGAKELFLNQLFTRTYEKVNHTLDTEGCSPFLEMVDKLVVIYGAGAFGQEVFNYLSSKGMVKCWIDSKADELQKFGMPVTLLKDAVIAMDDIVEEMQLLAMLCGVGCWPY